jgi:type II secretory pathway component GspD/PulD (secretin)
MKNFNLLINFASVDFFPSAGVTQGAKSQLSTRMKIQIAMVIAILFNGWNTVSFAQDTIPAAGEQASQAADNSLASRTPADARPDERASSQSAEPLAVKPGPRSDGESAVQLASTEVASSAVANQEAGSINIPEAPLADVISTLARQAGINFQFDPRVTGGVGPDGKPIPQPTVSIRWDNVTPLQALEALLSNHSMILVQDPKTKIARIMIKDPAAPEPLVTRVIHLKYATPTNIINIVQPTLGTRSKVLGDQRTSQLVVLATEKEMEAVDSLLAELDLAPKQILIEARLLETSKNPSSIKGIDWSGTLEAQNISFGNGKTVGTTETLAAATTTRTANLPSGRTVTGSVTTPAATVTKLTTALGNGGLSLDTARGFHPATAFLNADGVHAVLSFLNKDSATEVVATPRAVTLDNQTARLEVTRAFPIFKTTPGTSQTPAGSEITYTNLGTILTVTPRISGDTNISLKVVPEVSNIDSKDRQVSNGQEQTANIYAIRRIETQVTIPSGNTLVMGGLISDSSSKQYVKVPLLGDLPVVGLAFRHDSKVRNKSNLLIFITPTIVGDSDFQPAENTFLKTKIPLRTEKEESAWDSGKPYDWTRSVD